MSYLQFLMLVAAWCGEPNYGRSHKSVDECRAAVLDCYNQPDGKVLKCVSTVKVWK